MEQKGSPHSTGERAQGGISALHQPLMLNLPPRSPSGVFPCVGVQRFAVSVCGKGTQGSGWGHVRMPWGAQGRFIWRLEKAVGSSDGKGSTLSPHHVVKHASFCNWRQTRWWCGQGYQWAAYLPWLGYVKEHHRALLCPPPCCWVWLQELSRSGDSHDPHGNAKHRIQFPLQEFRDGFEGRLIKQSFGIAFAAVMLRGGIWKYDVNLTCWEWRKMEERALLADLTSHVLI